MISPGALLELCPLSLIVFKRLTETVHLSTQSQAEDRCADEFLRHHKIEDARVRDRVRECVPEPEDARKRVVAVRRNGELHGRYLEHFRQRLAQGHMLYFIANILAIPIVSDQYCPLTAPVPYAMSKLPPTKEAELDCRG